MHEEISTLDSVFNVEHSDSLGFKSDGTEVRSSRDEGFAQFMVIYGFPLHFSVQHFLNVHVAGQGFLSDGIGGLWSCGVGNVSFTPESLGYLVNVDGGVLRLVLRGKVVKVFKSDLDFVFGQWGSVKLCSIFDSSSNNLS